VSALTAGKGAGVLHAQQQQFQQPIGERSRGSRLAGQSQGSQRRTGAGVASVCALTCGALDPTFDTHTGCSLWQLLVISKHAVLCLLLKPVVTTHNPQTPGDGPAANSAAAAHQPTATAAAASSKPEEIPAIHTTVDAQQQNGDRSSSVAALPAAATELPQKQASGGGKSDPAQRFDQPSLIQTYDDLGGGGTDSPDSATPRSPQSLAGSRTHSHSLPSRCAVLQQWRRRRRQGLPVADQAALHNIQRSHMPMHACMHAMHACMHAMHAMHATQRSLTHPPMHAC